MSSFMSGLCEVYEVVGLFFFLWFSMLVWLREKLVSCSRVYYIQVGTCGDFRVMVRRVCVCVCVCGWCKASKCVWIYL